VFYSRVLNKTLQQAVEDSLGQGPEEQVAIFEELSLMRLAALDAVKLFSASQESKNVETRQAAAVLMRSAIHEVVKTAEAAARVNSLASDKVSVHNIKHVAAQITRIAHECMDLDQAKQFERLVRQRVKVQSTPEGVHTTPDMDVAEMDASVPK
jgi:hypothetical protein